jgi:hypothetical protein
MRETNEQIMQGLKLCCPEILCRPLAARSELGHWLQKQGIR